VKRHSILSVGGECPESGIFPPNDREIRPTSGGWKPPGQLAPRLQRVPWLKQMSFGSQIAEDEVNALAGYFVETNQWQKIANGEIDIIRGEKGAGKSAIYALLTTRVDDFFDRGILLVAAENPRGATVFKDLVADPPTSEQEFIVLWKLYILAIIAQQMRDYDFRGSHADKIYRSLEDAGLLAKEFNLTSVLRSVHDYARRLVKAEAFETELKFDPLNHLGAHAGSALPFFGKVLLAWHNR
jgi:hypothetical protein